MSLSQLLHPQAPPAFEVAVNIRSLTHAVDSMARRAAMGTGFTLFTVNLDHLVKLRGDSRFREAYERADFISADGWPIVWLLAQQGTRLQRTTGADLVAPLCAAAAERKLPVYFIGPGPASQRGAIDALTKRFSRLDVAGAEAPDLRQDLDEASIAASAERISASGARLCFVSLGAPKQELLADALRRRCPQVGFVCVGAALDFISGSAARAPVFAQRCGMEWAWRLMHDPRRLAKRYFSCLALFASILLLLSRRGEAPLRVADSLLKIA